MKREIDCKVWDTEYDVIVAGGGTTGCCAAVAAARQGAKVLIIEKLPFLGGNMSSGLPWLAFHDVESKELVVKGIPLEIITRLQAEGSATEFVMDPIAGSAVGVNGTMLKMLLFDMTCEFRIDVMLHSIVTGVSVGDGAVTDLTVHNKEGCQVVSGKVFIDCTDSADVCVLAGAESVLGRLKDGRRQVSSYVMTFGGIHFDRMFEYFDKHTDQIRPFELEPKTRQELLAQMRSSPLCVLGAFSEIIAKAKKDGIDYPRDQLVGIGYTFQGELSLVSSRVSDVDLNDVLNHSRAEVEGFRQTRNIIRLLKNYIPGCEDARIISSGTQLGIRETRHVVGDYELTADDLLQPHPIPDAIARGAYHLDVHSPDHAGLETQRPKIYHLPLRCLLVSGFSNLLVAGRGISATHEALSSTRITPISGALGEAAGVAAAVSSLSGMPIRAIPVSKIQNILVKTNCLI